jgi:peptide/nickel transport system permease protein
VRAYVTRRLLTMLVTVVGVSLVVFLLIRLIPGSIVDQLLGVESTHSQADVERVRAYFGLDQPIAVQYGRWLGGVVRGDLGDSFRTARPVWDLIRSALPVTAELALGATAVALSVGLPTGILAALRQRRLLDGLARAGSLVGLSIPSFWQGTMFILVFSLYLKWAPPAAWVSPFDDLWANLKLMVLPSITLGTASAATVQRMTRVSMLDVMRQDYIRTARAKGIRELWVILAHALKNSLIPVMTVVGLELGYLLSGAVVTEEVFNLPGIGRLVLSAIYQRDYPVVQGTVLFIAVIFISLNCLVDLLYAFVNPRIRYA